MQLSNSPVGLTIILIAFILFTILNIFNFCFPFAFKASFMLGRIFALSWAVLDGIIVFGLLVRAHWIKKAVVVAYIVTIISAIFSESFYVAVFNIIIWSLIYLTALKYLHKPEIDQLFSSPSRSDYD